MTNKQAKTLGILLLVVGVPGAWYFHEVHVAHKSGLPPPEIVAAWKMSEDSREECLEAIKLYDGHPGMRQYVANTCDNDLGTIWNAVWVAMTVNSSVMKSHLMDERQRALLENYLRAEHAMLMNSSFLLHGIRVSQKYLDESSSQCLSAYKALLRYRDEKDYIWPPEKK